MRSWIQISRIYSHSPILSLVQASHVRKIPYSTASQKVWAQLPKECDKFLPWLQRKSGCEISSFLSLGYSNHGRSLFASKPIQAGDCILKVPYNAQISSVKLHPEISALLDNGVDDISRLAIVLLAEKKLGRESEWAPYICSLPHISDMHNTMFWSKEELDMLQASSIYEDVAGQKAHLEEEFFALKQVLDLPPQMFGVLTLQDFMHAYTLVISRAWRTSRGISLIPFADFLNHDGASEADLLSDDMRETSEVIADRGYAAGQQVLIRYGKFPNSTLMLDFGFTLPSNIHDQVQIWMEIPKHDPLYILKSEFLFDHCFPSSPTGNPLKSSRRSFIIREVKSPKGKGRGIPQALRAYARILSISSPEDLHALGIEASKSDGRLARRSLRNKESEIQAHCILLSQFTRMIQDNEHATKDLESMGFPMINNQVARRKKMAIDLLNGELRVLKSACAWLTNYCASLSTCHVLGF